jgi:hypothetical protein
MPGNFKELLYNRNSYLKIFNKLFFDILFDVLKYIRKNFSCRGDGLPIGNAYPASRNIKPHLPPLYLNGRKFGMDQIGILKNR